MAASCSVGLIDVLTGTNLAARLAGPVILCAGILSVLVGRSLRGGSPRAARITVGIGVGALVYTALLGTKYAATGVSERYAPFALLAAAASAHALTSGGAALSSAKGLVRAWGATATAALVATVAATAVAVRGTTESAVDRAAAVTLLALAGAQLVRALRAVRRGPVPAALTALAPVAEPSGEAVPSPAERSVGCFVVAWRAPFIVFGVILLFAAPLLALLLLPIAAFVWFVPLWIRRGWSRAVRRDGPWSRLRTSGGVLYLRSFTADRTRVRASLLRHPTLRLGRVPFEEAVARPLWRVGPVVAAEATHGLAPLVSPLGAARRALPMDDWQKTLTQWIAGARLVVAAAGATEGLRWELAEVDRVGVMDRLLVVIALGHDPPTDVGPLALARPEALNHSIPPARIRAIVPRVEDHDAVYVVSDGHRDIDVEVATEVGAALVRARASSLDTAPERPVAAAHERAHAASGPLADPSDAVCKREEAAM